MDRDFRFVAFGFCYTFYLKIGPFFQPANDFLFDFGPLGGMATMSILDNDSNLGWGVFLLCWSLVLFKYLSTLKAIVKKHQ